MRNPNAEKLIDIPALVKRFKIEEDMKVADLGCGSHGHFVFPLADAVGNKGKVYAVDVLEKCVDSVKRRAHSDNYTNVQAIWSDLEVYKGTSIDSTTLDLAVLINVLHQSQKKESIIREASRMIKKHGRLIIVDWEKSKSPFGPQKKDRVEIDHLKLLAKKHSLNFEEEFFVGNHHYGLIFEKL